MNNRGKSYNKPSSMMNRNYDRGFDNQVSLYGNRDPFADMQRMMKGFGGFGGSIMRSNFGNDDFFKDDFMMNPFGGDLDQMMGNFSTSHQKVHQGGRDGTFVSHSYVSSSTIGSDGKVKKQSYYQNSAGQHKNGKTISQKQQGYKNNQGINRIAQERMLNNRGHKIVKQKRGEDIEQTNHYYNIEEDQAQQFHNNWRNVNNDIKFLQNQEKYNRGIQYRRDSQQPRQLGIEYQPSSYGQKRTVGQLHPKNQERNNYSHKDQGKYSKITGSRTSKKY